MIFTNLHSSQSLSSFMEYSYYYRDTHTLNEELNTVNIYTSVAWQRNQVSTISS